MKPKLDLYKILGTNITIENEQYFINEHTKEVLQLGIHKVTRRLVDKDANVEITLFQLSNRGPFGLRQVHFECYKKEEMIDYLVSNNFKDKENE